MSLLSPALTGDGRAAPRASRPVASSRALSTTYVGGGWRPPSSPDPVEGGGCYPRAYLYDISRGKNPGKPKNAKSLTIFIRLTMPQAT